MTKHERLLCSQTAKIMEEILEEGIAQGHQRDGFVDHPQDYHFDRAIRHLITARMIRDGHQKPDAEGMDEHLRRALCRVAMGIYRQTVERGT